MVAYVISSIVNVETGARPILKTFYGSDRRKVEWEAKKYIVDNKLDAFVIVEDL